MTVGFIEGGQARNVIPESVKFGRTYKSLTSEGLSHVKQRIKEAKHAFLVWPSFIPTTITILSVERKSSEHRSNVYHLQVIKAQAAVHRCSAVLDFKEDTSLPYPVMVNDEALYKHAKKVGESLLGQSNQISIFNVLKIKDLNVDK